MLRPSVGLCWTGAWGQWIEEKVCTNLALQKSFWPSIFCCRLKTHQQSHHGVCVKLWYTPLSIHPVRLLIIIFPIWITHIKTCLGRYPILNTLNIILLVAQCIWLYPHWVPIISHHIPSYPIIPPLYPNSIPVISPFYSHIWWQKPWFSHRSQNGSINKVGLVPTLQSSHYLWFHVQFSFNCAGQFHSYPCVLGKL